MSNLENPRFTERTSTNLGRSHRLPHVCTIMIYGKLGGHRLQETATFIYIYIIHRHQRPIWVSLMWILEKYNDITLKRGIANLGRSHRLPCVFNNFHFPSISINKCPSNTYLVLPRFLRWLIYIYILYHKCLTPSLMFLVGPRKSETDAAEHVISLLCISSQDRKSTMIFAKNYQQIWV